MLFSGLNNSMGFLTYQSFWHAFLQQISQSYPTACEITLQHAQT